MHLESLCLQNFRNYSSLEINISSSGALVVGENGSGKSNLLEAIYLLCTGRSQRGVQRKAMIRHGETTAFASGAFCAADSLPTKIHFGFSSDNKAVIKVNERKAHSFSQWFGTSRIVPFGPPDMMLIQGDPSERRGYMNMVLSQSDSKYLDALISYKRDLVNRNVLLTRSSGGKEIDVYEERMAESGSYLMESRAAFFGSIAGTFTKYYDTINAGKGCGRVQYRPSITTDAVTQKEVFQQILHELREKRGRDADLGFSMSGPHRDDFACLVEEGKAASYASQGQCRSLSICLRLCAISFLQQYDKDKKIIILVDDAFCELDSQRVSRIYPLIKDKGQLFVTSTSVSS